MLIVETIARIRREHFIKGKTIKEIARDLKVSRNTVRKVLRSGETSFEYERQVQPRPKLGRWAVELDGLLAANAAKPAREQLTLIRIFEELRSRGYDGGYDAVRRYARRWSKERGQSTAAAYVPLSFAPGEAYQFDWSHEVVLLSGTTVMVKAAHVRLCHSRMLFVRAYPRETQEMVFDAHDRAFALFKGTCTRGIYDNMKTAVETIFVGKGRLYNRRFLQMCSHYLVDPVACTPASGWEKGQVENQVGLVRERFFTPRLRFKNLDELNAWLLDKCIAYAKVHRHPELVDQTIWEVFEAERPQTRSLCRPLRRLPCGDGIGLEDLPGALRQQQVLGRSQRSRATGRGSSLCRSHRDPSGWTHRCRAPAILWPRRYRLRPLALCAGARPQTRRLAQRCSLQRLGAASRDRADPAQACQHRRRQSTDGRHPQRGAD
ncbi:putative integrase, catalytic region [Bradyrhizobium diazoefficiens SEMIA 5080]|uniref:Putative integrase, catalytic region n=1 Tax=Bradyrhizobium diazoefficiens SEMIA 5080 TaxID=754504 RepID=A0A837CQS3_9BRAD|nr:putative integrase, catalytic region [Bradyrhizobium diazoefficiens SEMIA 5080]